jgi:hypothetical protein
MGIAVRRHEAVPLSTVRNWRSRRLPASNSVIAFTPVVAAAPNIVDGSARTGDVLTDGLLVIGHPPITGWDITVSRTP